MILSDVHGNLPALEAVLDDAQPCQPEQIWNLGDFLGYGPFVNEVVDLLFDQCSAHVIGNYDLKVLKFPDKKNKWEKSKQKEKFIAFQWAWQHLSKKNARRLQALPKQQYRTVGRFKLFLTHGSPAKVSELVGPKTSVKRLGELARMTHADIILSGHTHVPFLKTVQQVTFINPGSVGRPEGKDPRASYAIVNLFSESFTVEFYRVNYDIERMVRALHAAELPEDFSEMFKTGQNLNEVQDCKVSETMVQSPDYSDSIKQVRQFALHCRYEAEHSEQVTRLAQILFDRLEAIHNLGKEERFLLTSAGLLHDIGWMQGQKAHHKTAMEMILQDLTLPLTQWQRKIVALVARYHRKALPQDEHPIYGQLSSKDQNTVRMLAGILRIADGLDRSHLSCVQDIEVRKGQDQMELQCKTNDLATPEMWAAQKKADLLEQVLSKKVNLSVVHPKKS